MNIYDQLQAVEDRYEELGELLSDLKLYQIPNASWSCRVKRLTPVKLS